ncbi:hypothetical protein ALP84_05237 [Pseudomonas cichorii]|uniref:Uncharacterized protein n=1 Tax=Pseudomonas cichorii TaxID=36746 RepID=A0A3M4WEH0_PSECI|nr:hypothetical protein ALP84_05237 [Pseudomonas cichorii]
MRGAYIKSVGAGLGVERVDLAGVAHRRKLRWLDDLNLGGDLRQPGQVDLCGRRNTVLVIGQLCNALHQVEQTQVGIERRDIRTALYRQQIPQQHSGRTSGDLQGSQSGDGGGGAQCPGRVQHIDRGLDQLADRDIAVQHVGVADGIDVQVGLEPVQVAEHAQVGIRDALPVGDTEVQGSAQQAADHGVEKCGLGAVDGHRGAADGQGCQWRCTCRDRYGTELNVRRSRRLVENRSNARRDASGDGMSGDDPDGLGFGGVGSKGAFAVEIKRQGAAVDCQRAVAVASHETVPGCALVGECGGTASWAAGAFTACRFQCGHVRYTLQRALFQIQPATVDDQQRAQQGKSQSQPCKQADGTTLPCR